MPDSSYRGSAGTKKREPKPAISVATSDTVSRRMRDWLRRTPWRWFQTLIRKASFPIELPVRYASETGKRLGLFLLMLSLFFSLDRVEPRYSGSLRTPAYIAHKTMYLEVDEVDVQLCREYDGGVFSFFRSGNTFA